MAKGLLLGGRNMKSVIVVTDSSATVPAELVQELNIRVVPIILALDGHSFRDGEEITPVDVYRWLRESKHLPTTASPSVGDFLRVYYTAAQQASAIVSIHLSPRLSTTLNVAVAASRLIENVPIHVVDCHTAAMAHGFVVIEAARAAAHGAGPEAVVARAEEVAAKVNLLATLDTLEYLYRGGRIGGAAALAGAMLQIKPVLYVADGQVGVFAKPRTHTKAIRVMLEHMAEQVDGHRLHAAVLHADVPEEAEALRQQVAERFDCTELYVTELTPVMGAHTGPGVLGVVFYSE
jgi:DegV family protein with EDD domain